MTATVLDTEGRPLHEGALVRMHPRGDLARVLSLPAEVAPEPGEDDSPAAEIVVRYPLDGEELALPVFAREGYAICLDLRSGR